MEKQTNNFKVVLEKKTNLNVTELNSITNYQEVHMEEHVKRHYGNATRTKFRMWETLYAYIIVFTDKRKWKEKGVKKVKEGLN